MNRYGGYGGMYGGMGGMYGGYGGMGMYNRMGMGGMYGGMGMNGQQQGGIMEKLQYIFALCEIGQMVEYNANGLAAFWQILKSVSTKLANFCSTTLVTIALWVFATSVKFKQFTATKIKEFLFEKNLSKEQLQT